MTSAAGRTFASARRVAAALVRDPTQFSVKKIPRECPICGYRGTFISVGRPARWDARCPSCGSRERHRLAYLWAHENGGDKLAGARILHFAPEKAIMRMMRRHPGYETADLHQPGVTHTLDITDTKLPDASYDVVMAHHVLEHIVDDRKAMGEIARLIRPGGFAVLSVPINSSRRETYENPAVTTDEGRFVHFGGTDHKRYYGLDFADRLADAGFAVETFRMPPADEIRYGLLQDEWIYVARKPSA